MGNSRVPRKPFKRIGEYEIYLSYRPASHILTNMTWADERITFFKRMDDKADLIRKHIPVVDVSLIVEDFLAEPITWWEPKHALCANITTAAPRRSYVKIV